MRSSLGLLRGNIMMTELESKVIKRFIDNKTLIFYGRYADDTLVVRKPEDLNHVHNSTYLLTLFPIFQIFKYIRMVQEFIVNPPIQVNKSSKQEFLNGVIKLNGSLVLLTLLQLPVIKQKFKLNSIKSKKLLLGMVFQNGQKEY